MRQADRIAAASLAALGIAGTCPPQGDRSHRYVFTGYARKTAHLDVAEDNSAAAIGSSLHANVLAQARPRYGR